MRKEIQKEVDVKFKRMHKNATLPVYAHPGDIGMDVSAVSVEYDEEKDIFIYSTGLACESDVGIGTFGAPRSSNCKTECYLPNSIATVDSATYRGDIQFRYKLRTSRETWVHNTAMTFYARLPWYSKLFHKYSYDKLVIYWRKYYIEHAIDMFAPYEVNPDVKIGQLVVLEHPYVNVIETDILSETERGTGGFGSTNKVKTKKINKKSTKTVKK